MGKAFNLFLYPSLIHRFPVIVVKVVAICLIGIPQKVFQECAVGIVCIVVIGAVDGSRVKAADITLQ